MRLAEASAVCLVLVGCSRPPERQERAGDQAAPVTLEKATEKAKELGASLLRCLKEQDRQGFVALFLSPAELDEAAGDLKIDEAELAESRKRNDELQGKVPGYYDEALSLASELGIDWQDASLTDVRVKVSASDEGWFRMSWMDVLFESKGKKYIIRMDDGRMFPGREWRFTDDPKENIRPWSAETDPHAPPAE